MKIKFRKEWAQVNANYCTSEKVRAYMTASKHLPHEAVQHNMNFYKLCENEMLVHVYDVYEVE